MKANIELTDYQKDIIAFLKRNKNKRDLFIATIPHVATSGMSRDIKLAVFYKGEFTNITWLVAKIMGKKLSKREAINIGGCGMDMIFATLENFYSCLGVKQPWKYSAIQHYKYF